ncbi:hypothetical protein H0H92_013683 [Tricholoma furcatifolium]|nr:hypothetical protein H0H92_013683 [Tricholoma furcatifolium]
MISDSLSILVDVADIIHLSWHNSLEPETAHPSPKVSTMESSEKYLSHIGTTQIDEFHETQELGIDPVLEKAWRKIDIFALPVVAMFYLLSFLDRTNLGNARVAGLQADLKMSNYEYSIALTATFVPYCVAQVPSNLALKIIGPNLLLPTMLTLWGIVATLQGFVQNYSGLLACRFFIGLLEAFFSSASLSGAFSGILAYGIIQMNGLGHRPGWSWIFILEGLFTVLFGLTTFFTLPRSPAHARFLTEKEKHYVMEQLRQAGSTGGDDHVDDFSWREIWQAITLPQVWMGAVLLFFNVTMIGAYLSDHFGARGVSSIFSGVLQTIGFTMFLVSNSPHVKYGSLFFTITGGYSGAPTLATWVANNVTPHTRRAASIGICMMMTNLGGILMTWLFAELSPAPLYRKATITLLIFSVLTIVTTVINIAYLAYQNRKKAAIRETISRANETPGIGDRSAWFMYQL